ncbi:MAG TPA: Rieske (2Fe-2S) protein [Actinomycetota bacterium]|nr:Rieske (2Fe-2S) protein [Actinomycetota bacterium]
MKRPERIAAAAFSVAIAAALALFVAYVQGSGPQAEGVLLALALGGVGVGLLVWATRLMPHIRDETQPRKKTTPATEADRESAVETVEAGVDEIKRRRFLSRLLVGAAGALGLAALIPIRSLGRSPGDSLFRTKWTSGARLVTSDGTPVTSSTLEIGSFITVFPEGHEGSSDSQAVLIRVAPDQLQLPPERGAGAPDGLVAYSKICTHAGCPLGLYLAATHELRCPCHQSTFDVLDSARPVYGPAPRPLPQLPIEIDGAGGLRATGDFTDPVGPSFWEEA